ncbi:(deoxy)nucleoside triphosphate pyrophosphohydrolase [Paenibacillus sp. 1001270B_150601_E10]|uniref:(deoxy)nucleoside triphosphate pyrophosphohydrolase n=1 Tax=Paenibacillus sp. 1001270B_150601_E10 TaxID=2787079 RepID=UPI0018A09D5A|nr:(deoxy)nucleoside triphosphate pyrophosphohydrolase [Paenibacillus sp. 1001270B_150601_E10]
MLIEVAAAIIENEQGELLIARKREGTSNAGLWEFPGGKLEQLESPQECLKRELLEEMRAAIEPYAYFGTHDHVQEERTIRLIAWRARLHAGQAEEWVLTDHDAIRWVVPRQLKRYEFAPADHWFVDQLLQEARKSSE